ncbi:MAG: Glutathione-binding protein GsiB [Paracidovorax wautersii]|uniref:Glutathione-binding protein GsiB n=1 Tax=Paracidovorax wautersii TaxID=1177982 RepID=A0A7V8FRD7_9BURK|nr:MAG: Glutathione-binding protein GsiB [Paracidovorax wautersii]
MTTLTLKLRLLAAALCFTAAAGTVPLASAETVRWSRSSDAATLDPHSVNTGTNINVSHQLYEPLVLRDIQGKLIPALATTWKLTSDPTVWEFKLRPGVKFHNGATLTADDVVFSLERAMAPSSGFKSLLASIEKISASDNLTVQIKTKGPNLILPDNLVNIFIVNAAWSKANKAELPQDEKSAVENHYTRNVNGTGPYVLASREQDARTVLKLFPDYWGKGQVPLQVTELVFLPIKSPATRVAALLSGEVDFLQDVPVQDIARLQGTQSLRVNEGAENRTIFLGLNVGAEPLKYADVKDKNPLADPRVRQAFNLAIDRDAIKRAVMRGMSQPAGIISPPFVHGYEKAFDQYPKPDANQAKKLLADAGYPNGFGITLHCPNDRYVNDEAICTALSGFLGRIGVKATVAARPIALHSAAINSADTDFYLFGWGVPTFDSAYIFDYLVYTRGKDGRGATNATRYSNPALDRQILSLSSESDVAKRDATLHDIWSVVQKEQIYIPLHNQVLHYAMKRTLDIPIDPMNYVFFKNVKVGAK